MAARKTIVLLIIFLALLAYVYFFEIQGERRKKAQQDQEQLVLNIDKEKVTGISFLPEKIMIERNDTEWKILFPVQTHADQSTIDKILDSFSSLKQGRFVSDNRDDFPKFGLTPFQSALVINKREENGDTLFLGNTNLDNTKVFYRKSGSNSVYLVATILKTNATKSLYDLRDKSILKFEKGEINSILIDKRRQAFSCMKDENQQWWLKHPIQARADDDKIDDILNELDNSKVARFESERTKNLRKYDLHNPWLTISLFDSSRKQQRSLYVGRKDKKQYYAKNESRPSIFLIDSTLVAELNVSLFDLRDKTIVSFEQDSVTEIILQHSDFTFHCIKDSTKKWFITQPESGLAKSWKISSLLYNIKDMKVAQFIHEPYKSDTFYGFVHPEIKLILKKKEGQSLTELLIGKKVNDKIYLKNNLTNHVYLVNIKVIDNLSIKTEEFLEK